jgi:hypothetical protein
MAVTVSLTVRIADLPAVKAAMADAVTAAVAAEQQRFAVLVRATCACRSCKDGVAAELLRSVG